MCKFSTSVSKQGSHSLALALQSSRDERGQLNQVDISTKPQKKKREIVTLSEYHNKFKRSKRAAERQHQSEKGDECIITDSIQQALIYKTGDRKPGK